MLLLGTLTSSWFKVPEGETGVSPEREHPVSFSLRSAEVCAVDSDSILGMFDLETCRNVSYEDIGAADSESVAVMKRSEEHTSELQSQSNLVCRLLLEKKKKK